MVLGLAISPDGRHVACLSGKFATTMVVWTCYASDGMLPDYDSFDLTSRWMENDVMLEKLESLLNQYGVSFMNCLHSCGTSFLVKAILKANPRVIEKLFKHALKCRIKISLFLKKELFVDGKLRSISLSLVVVSILTSAPLAVTAMMNYLVKRITHEQEVNDTLELTLNLIGFTYPNILFDVLNSPNLFGSCNEIKVRLLLISLFLDSS